MELLQELTQIDIPISVSVQLTALFLRTSPRPGSPLDWALRILETRQDSTAPTDLDEEVPLKVIVLARYDLRMSPGKLAAQVGHAIHSLCRECDEVLIDQWEEEPSYSKIVVLGVENLSQLTSVCDAAEEIGIGVFTIEDAGRTEVEPGSLTVTALGPCYEPILDYVTGHLRPYKPPTSEQRPQLIGSNKLV